MASVAELAERRAELIEGESLSEGVRVARPSDATAIAQIYNEGIAERIATFETEPRAPEQIEVRLRDQADVYPTVVVERGGEVVAWAGASPYSARPCYAGIGEFSVYTARAARRMGAGRIALAGLLHLSAERGLWKLVSRIFPENEASLSLCRSLGFREVGVYRGHARLDGVWRDVVIVERLLGEAEGSAER
jgi:L-amino acid N-acyltransferase YncA